MPCDSRGYHLKGPRAGKPSARCMYDMGLAAEGSTMKINGKLHRLQIRANGSPYWQGIGRRSSAKKPASTTKALAKRAEDMKKLNSAELRELELLMDSLYEGRTVNLEELGVNLDRITVGDARNIAKGLLKDPFVLNGYSFAPLITSKGSSLFPEKLSEYEIEDIIE